MKPFELAQARTIGEAIGASGQSFLESRHLAGGTDLLGTIKDRVETPARLVNLKGIPGLRQIEVNSEHTRIGALATHTEVAEHGDVREKHPALIETILKCATPQVRNAATIGGGLCQRPRCWYFRHPDYLCRKKGGMTCYAQDGENEFHTIFDNGTCCAVHASNLAPVLLAYDATLTIWGPDGSREVAIDDFFVDPDDNVTVENILQPNEVLTHVTIPASARGWGEAYVEAREKQSFDWALAGSTVLMKLDGGQVKNCRVVISAVAPRPMRLVAVEEMLTGKPSGKTIANACEKAIEGATPLEQNAYKLVLLKTTLARAINSALERGRKA